MKVNGEEKDKNKVNRKKCSFYTLAYVFLDLIIFDLWLDWPWYRVEKTQNR